MPKIPLVYVLGAILLAFTAVNADTIFFNTSVITRCTAEGGCDILDPTIYEGGILPNDTDTVVYNVTEPVLLYLGPGPDPEFHVDSLNASGPVTLAVRGNATFGVGVLFLDSAVVLEVHESGFAHAARDVIITGNSSLLLLGGSFMAVSITNLFLNQSSVIAFPGAIFHVNSESVYLSGFFNFTEYSTYLVESPPSSPAVYDHCQFSFSSTPSFQSAEFRDVQAVFQAGLSGSNITLIASNFDIYGLAATNDLTLLEASMVTVNALTLLETSMVTVNALTLIDASIVIVNTNSAVLFSDIVSIQGASSLILHGNFSGSNATSFTLSNDSSVVGYDGSIFQVHGHSFSASGTLNFSANSSYNVATSLSLYDGSTLLFLNQPILGNSAFFGISALFPQGFLTRTSIFLEDSLIDVSGSPSSSTSIGNLALSGSTLRVHPNSATYVEGNVAIIDNSHLEIFGFFLVTTFVGNFTLSNDSSIVGHENSTFQAYGNYFYAAGSLHFAYGSTYDEGFDFSVYNQAQLSFLSHPTWADAAFYNVNVSFPAGFEAQSALLVGSSFTVFGQFGVASMFAGFSIDNTSSVHFDGADGFISNSENPSFGLSGTGTYVISSSSLHTYFPYSYAVTAPLVFVGKTYFNADFISLDASLLHFADPTNGEDTFVTFDFYGNTSITGDIQIPGEIKVNSGFVVLNGSISLSGNITGEVYAEVAQVHVLGSLSCASIFLAGNYSRAHSLTVVNATITAASITIVGDFVVRSVNTSYFVGNFSNQGSLIVTEQNKIIVQGVYEQHANATFVAHDLLENSTVVPLFVDGIAYIDGVIKYDTLETKVTKTTTFTVLYASDHVNGSFVHETFDDRNDVDATASISYSKNTIEVTLKPKPGKSSNMLKWWVWLLIGVGAVAVVVILLVVIVRRSRRTEYEPVH